MKPQVLIVEGKPTDRTSFTGDLFKKGFDVESVPTGAEAIKFLKNNKPQVIVVDADSMRTSGTRICTSIRRVTDHAPIILVSTHGQKAKKGYADVILELPFSFQKLLNRLRPYIGMGDNKMLEVGPIKLDLEQRWVHCNKKKTRLTPRLFLLMKMLMKKPGVMHTREDLFRKLWETEYFGDTRSLDVHISWLRKAIEKDPRRPKILGTKRGVGYFLDIKPPEPISKK